MMISNLAKSNSRKINLRDLRLSESDGLWETDGETGKG